MKKNRLSTKMFFSQLIFGFVLFVLVIACVSEILNQTYKKNVIDNTISYNTQVTQQLNNIFESALIIFDSINYDLSLKNYIIKLNQLDPDSKEWQLTNMELELYLSTFLQQNVFNSPFKATYVAISTSSGQVFSSVGTSKYATTFFASENFKAFLKSSMSRYISPPIEISDPSDSGVFAYCAPYQSRVISNGTITLFSNLSNIKMILNSAFKGNDEYVLLDRFDNLIITSQLNDKPYFTQDNIDEITQKFSNSDQTVLEADQGVYFINETSRGGCKLIIYSNNIELFSSSYSVIITVMLSLIGFFIVLMANTDLVFDGVININVANT